MPTTSPLKRPSAGGRLGRLLASLRPPARAGPLPVQTGFPTSLADLIVKNHGRLKHPNRRRHSPPSAAPPSSPSPPPVVAAQPAPAVQEQRREALTVQNQSAVAGRRGKGAAFSIRPEVLAVGGAVALVLLVVWSKWLVAAATAASVALVWIESSASRRLPPPETTTTTTKGPVLCGRGVVSPIREEAETPRSSSADSDTGSDVCSVWAGDTAADLASGGDDSNLITANRKEKRRHSLRKLIAKKLRKNGKRSAKEEDTDTGSLHGSESNHSDAGLAGVNAEPVVTETEPALPLPVVPSVEYARAPEAITGERCRQLQGGALLVPIILVGLVVGKLPAVALTVLCVVFYSSVDRVPATI